MEGIYLLGNQQYIKYFPPFGSGKNGRGKEKLEKILISVNLIIKRGKL